ncbi:MAG: hypothetical protein Q4B99_04690 [Clostridia bacterium]|nr:hypothetical protein [Clostridia bacterium]
MAGKEDFRISIYDIIQQLDDIIEDSPRPTFGGGERRIVDVESVRELLRDMKVEIDEDIRRAVSVLSEADKIMDTAEIHAKNVVNAAEERASAIVSAAEEKANGICDEAERYYADVLDDARQKREELISSDSVRLEAQRRANALKAKAEHEAQALYDNAAVYADDVMSDIARFLNLYLRQVNESRAELGANDARRRSGVQQPEPVATATDEAAPQQAAASPRAVRKTMPRTVESVSAPRQDAPAQTTEFERVKAIQPSEVVANEPQDADDYDENDDAPKKGFFAKLAELIRGKEEDDEDITEEEDAIFDD